MKDTAMKDTAVKDSHERYPGKTEGEAKRRRETSTHHISRHKVQLLEEISTAPFILSSCLRSQRETEHMHARTHARMHAQA